MSHFTKLDRANITSPEAFIAACKELGLTDISRNAKVRGYSGNSLTCDVAVKLPGQYDIGLKKGEGNKYDLIADWTMMSMPDSLRPKLGDRNVGLQNALIRLTTKHTLISQYRRQGFIARVSEDSKHNLTVTLTR